MKLWFESAEKRNELVKKINVFLSSLDGTHTILFEPKIFFQTYRKKWYCIFWFSDV